MRLLTPEERERDGKDGEMDLEQDSGRVEAPKDKNLDHEYSVASTVKFAWLGTYFFFSLLLTLYNKLVLGMVSTSPASPTHFPPRHGRMTRPSVLL
jgi:hypothetical protein